MNMERETDRSGTNGQERGDVFMRLSRVLSTVQGSHQYLH